MRGYPGWWAGVSWLTLALLPPSLIFSLLVRLRRALYAAGILRSVRLPVPVVVVGNIAAGGAGKTPLTVWVARALRARGLHPGILARGVGGRSRVPLRVDARSDPAEAGDEPVLLARRGGVPVWVGRDRVAAGRALLAAHPGVDVLICDDGMQHYRLARDAEIAVVDGARGVGNRLPLPAGPLREGVTRLNRVCAVVVNGDGQAALKSALADPVFDMPPVFEMQLVPKTLRRLCRPEDTRPCDAFARARVHGVAGIADPERFFRALEGLGMQVTRHPFPDHHAFRREDMPSVGTVLMTEKDGVKCAAFAAEDWWQMEVSAEVPDLLADRLLDCIKTLATRARTGRA